MMKNRKNMIYVLIGLILFVLGASMYSCHCREGFKNSSNGLVLEGNTNKERTEDFQKYIDSLPTVSKNNIPAGEEDKYILKTQIVPPVCPRCPDVIQKCDHEGGSDGGSGGGSSSKCPPCPAPQRCPEPAYDCKLVPNFRKRSGDHIPRPLLTDFSQFGM